MALFMKDPKLAFLTDEKRAAGAGAKSLVAWYERLSSIVLRSSEPASRSYRYMARLIEREFPVGERGVCLAFSSPDSDTVSTDAMLMLAYCLRSELEGRVLLVDARLRDREDGLTGRLGLLEASGFAEVMAGEAGAPDTIVLPTAVAGVDFLPCGKAGTAPADRERLGRLLDEVRTRYSHVLVQVGSVLKDTRSVVIVAQADAMFLLARENRTFMKSLDDSRELLDRSGVTDVRGVVSGRGR